MHRLRERKAEPHSTTCEDNGFGFVSPPLFLFWKGFLFLELWLISKFHFRVHCTLVAEVSQEKRENSKSPLGSKASSVV